MQPIVGFRCWIIDLAKPDLKSVAHNHVWPKQQEAKAVCFRSLGWSLAQKANPEINPEHEPPAEQCMCGLYARTTIDGVKQEYPYYPVHGYWGGFAKVSTQGLMVMGAVLMWGDINRGEKVIRASHARVLCLTDLDDPWTKLTGANNPDNVSPEVRLLRSNIIDQIAEAYAVPFVPYNAATMYAGEFGELAVRPAKDDDDQKGK